MHKKDKKPRINQIRNLIILMIIIITIITFAVIGIFQYKSVKSKFLLTQNRRQFKAAIVDQLSISYPNEELIREIKEKLRKRGFDVIIYKGKDITVNFFKEISSYNLIIFRAHSGLRRDKSGKILQTTFIFTNEKYSQFKYINEQLKDEVLIVKVTDNSPAYFAIGPKFVKDCVRNRFKNTCIIMAGCAGLKYKDLARAFIEKGASCYIAWDASVNADYMDKFLSSIIYHLIEKNEIIENAVKNTMQDLGNNEYNAILKYYPSWVKDKTLIEIIR